MVVGSPTGYLALNVAAPWAESEASAPTASCGSVCPLMRPRSAPRLPASVERTSWLKPPLLRLLLRNVASSAPLCGVPTVVTDATLASLAHTQLRPWINDRPEIAEQLLRVLARRLRRTNDALADLIFTDVPGRVAKQLLELSERFGSEEPDGRRVHHDLTQEELAQLVGASRETVNKALADFASRGWVRVDSRALTILDGDRLARRAR